MICQTKIRKLLLIGFNSFLILTFFLAMPNSIGNIQIELNIEQVVFVPAQGAFDIWVEDDFAYVTCGYRGLRIFDISDHTNITEVTHIEQSYNEGFAHQIVVKNNIAYIGNGRGGLWIINVTNPINPEVISDFVGPDPGLYGWDIKIKANTLFLASGSLEGNYPGIAVINITTPEDPSLITIFNSSLITDIDLINENLFFISKFGGVTIVDISNVSDPTLISEYNPPDITSEVIGNGILINDDLAYICVYEHEISIFNISNPLNIVPLDINLSDYISPFHATSQDDFIYFTDLSRGLYVYNFTVPERPIRIGYLFHLFGPYIPRFFQNTFYLTYQGVGFAIHNITEVVPSTTVGTTDTSTITTTTSSPTLTTINTITTSATATTTNTTSPTTIESISVSNNVSLIVCFLGLITSQVILKLRRKEEIK